MTSGRDDRYVRLLSWYPKAWRDAHGTVFVDTLREQSEHEGRTRPSRSESFAAMVNGLGARMDARLAGTLALSGIALMAVIQSAAQVFGVGGEFEPVRDGALMALIGAVPMLVLAGVVSLARTYGLVAAGRAVAVLVLGWAALALATEAVYAGALGFLPIDNTPALAALAAASVPLAGAAIGLGVVGSWLFMESVLSRTRLRLPLRMGLSVLAAGVLAFLGGLPVLGQSDWLVVVTVGVVALSLRSLGAYQSPRPLTTPTSAHRGVLLLAGVSAGTGSFGILYAMTGSVWSPAAVDESMARRQGILIVLTGSMILVAALGVLASRRGHRSLHVWGPLTVLSLVIASVMLAVLRGYAYPDPAQMAVLGIAVAWWVIPRLHGPQRDRWMAGAAIVLTSVVFRGDSRQVLALGLAGVVAAIVAFRRRRQRRRVDPVDPRDATVVGA
jgi:hypothetical protein